jgi:drug/metabolite transporter (DMT)-like permease
VGPGRNSAEREVSSGTLRIPPIDFVALAGCGLAWGLTPTVVKYAGRTGVQVIAFSGLQAAAAALILGVVLLARGQRLKFDRRHVLFWLVQGAIGMGVPNILLFLGMRHVPAGLFGLMAPLSPALTAVALALLGAEAVSHRVWLGSAVAFAGVALAMAPGAALPTLEALPWAAALLLVPTCYALSNVVAATWQPPGADSMALACGTLLASASVLLPIALLAGHLAPPPEGWGAAVPWIVFQGALQATAFLLFFRLMGRRGGVFTSQVGYIVTLSGLVWGLALFGERPGWLTIPAVTLVLLGLWLVTVPRRA